MSRLWLAVSVLLTLGSAEESKSYGEHEDCALKLQSSSASSGRNLCIRYEDVDELFTIARQKVGLRYPARETTDQTIALLGTALQETTRLLARRFWLSRREIETALPRLETSLTEIGRFCARALTASESCQEERYRRHEGTCNNLEHPAWGAASFPFGRLLLPQYADHVSEPRAGRDGFPLPAPRQVSSTVHADASTKHEHRISFMFPAWGQLIDHDLTLTAETKDPETRKDVDCCGGGYGRHQNCLPIEIPEDDPFYSEKRQTCMNFARSLAGVRPGCRLAIHRMLDQKLEDYGNTIDAVTADMIEEGRKRLRERKYFRIKLMTYAMYGAVATLTVLKPIFEIYIARKNEQDPFRKNINWYLPIKCWYFLDVKKIGVQLYMWIALYYVIIQGLFVAAGTAVAYIVISEELCSNIFVLNLTLRHLIRRSSFIGDGKVNKTNLNECFKRCVIHHQNIIRCFELFQEYFRWVIWLALTVCTYQICVSGLLLTLESTETMEIGIGLRLVAFTFLVGQVIYLFFFCLYGEEVEGMSSEIYYAAYNMEWFDYATEMKQNLQILRIRALNPLKFSCGGLFFANFDTFSNVMNGAYSYFSLLKASLNKKE